MSDDGERHPLIENLAERRARHLERGRLYRVSVMIVGLTITLGGLAMLVLPGPALLVIPIGLALLALEFAWAERLLERAVDRAEKARRTATEASRAQKVFSALTIAAAAAAGVSAAIVWDIPLLPF
jgi:uncharacterized protein (TIGR02611 family)